MDEILRVTFQVKVRPVGYGYKYSDSEEVEIEMDVPASVLGGGVDFTPFIASMVLMVYTKWIAAKAEREAAAA